MRSILLVLTFTLISLSCMAQSSNSDSPDLVTRDLGQDHFAAGDNVGVDTPVAGDLIAAGQETILDSSVAGDAVLAGGTVRVNGMVSQNVFAAGGQVYVNGSVARNARLAGGQVEIAPSAHIDGNVSIATGEARVNGTISGYLQAVGGRLYINGPVGGDVEVSGSQIELGPETRISGKLRYRTAGQLKRDPAAQVAGGIEQLPLSQAGFGRGFGRTFFWIWTLGLMLVVTILIPLVPTFFTDVSQTLQTRPGASGLLGLGTLFLVPVASVFMLATVLGVPLALLSMTVFFALLMVSYVAAGAAIGDWFLKRLQPAQAGVLRWKIGAAIGGILLLALISEVPFLGPLAVFATFLMGIGAVGLYLNALRHDVSTPPPTVAESPSS